MSIIILQVARAAQEVLALHVARYGLAEESQDGRGDVEQPRPVGVDLPITQEDPGYQ